MVTISILCGDALEQLRTLPDESAQCCITSPPYYGLRDYGIAGQIGMEPSPEVFIDRLVEVLREVKRVLRDDGTLWVNIGDSYAGSGKSHGTEGWKQRTNAGSISSGIINYKEKDLLGVPWMLAFALRADGWYLRQDIVWSKPSCMPESVKDRCTRAHEYIFMLTKSRKYFYNAAAISEPAVYFEPNAPDKIKSLYGQGFTRRANDPNSIEARKERASMDHKAAPSAMKNGIRPYSDKQRGHSRRHAGFNDRWDQMEKKEQCNGMRNKRSVWTIGPDPFPEAHFATFPEELPTLCILAGSKEGDVILDPFAGAGTTLLAALKLNRSAIGIELNPKYVEMIHKRIYGEIPMIYADAVEAS